MIRFGNPLGPNFMPPGYRFDDRKNIVLNDNIDKIIKIYNSTLRTNAL